MSERKQASLYFIGKMETGGWSLLFDGEFMTMIKVFVINFNIKRISDARPLLITTSFSSVK